MAAGSSNARVVVVGAGPVGMICALALNRRGVAVTVFEQEPAPVTDQRAASIHPPTLQMLDELGVAQAIIPLGLQSPSYRFHDRVTRSVVAEFDLGLMSDEFRFPFVLQYEQYKLTASITAAYANAGDFDVRFAHAVTDIRDRGGHVDRPLPPQHEPGHHSDLSDKHHGEDEQAPQRRAPEFPDTRWARGGINRRERGRTFGIEDVHQFAFKFSRSSCPDKSAKRVFALDDPGIHRSFQKLS